MVIVVVLGTRLTFFNDDWYFLLQRPGFASQPGVDEFLAPHNGHLELLPATFYEVLSAAFGLDAQLPFRLLLGLGIAAVGVGVYALVTLRVGTIPALCAAAIVLLLGPAWEALLLFNSISIIGSLAFGLGALWALQEDSPRRNGAACALLVGSLCMSNGGIPFIAAAAVAILLRRRPTQAWIPAIPAVVFGAWYAAYGHTAKSYVSAENLANLPKYVLDSAAMGLTSIAGLNRGVYVGHYARGYVLLALLASLMAVRVVRRGRPPAFTLVVASAAFGFWALTGISYASGREPLASRYQLIDAALILVIVAAFFAPLRPARATVAAIVVASTIAVALNLETLFDDGYSFMHTQSEFAKVDLGALEIAGSRAAPNTWLIEAVARNPFLSGVTAERYFAVTGTKDPPPVASPEAIAAAPPEQRQAADSVLANAYGIARGPLPAPADCRAVQGTTVSLARGDAFVTNPGTQPVVISVGRFAPPERTSKIAFVAPDSTTRIRFPRDSVALPWRLSASGNASICVA